MSPIIPAQDFPAMELGRGRILNRMARPLIREPNSRVDLCSTITFTAIIFLSWHWVASGIGSRRHQTKLNLYAESILIFQESSAKFHFFVKTHSKYQSRQCRPSNDYYLSNYLTFCNYWNSRMFVSAKVLANFGYLILEIARFTPCKLLQL